MCRLLLFTRPERANPLYVNPYSRAVSDKIVLCCSAVFASDRPTACVSGRRRPTAFGSDAHSSVQGASSAASAIGGTCGPVTVADHGTKRRRLARVRRARVRRGDTRPCWRPRRRAPGSACACCGALAWRALPSAKARCLFRARARAPSARQAPAPLPPPPSPPSAAALQSQTRRPS